ncbi:MAG: hypothetical protein K2L10_10280 [Ruminococcus sp.]|nr:hypothetical protein [Ruminococcus sp.]
MNDNLYYCKDWKHQSYKDYDICVSDFVEEPTKGVLLQIHCLVTHNNKVVCRNMKDVVGFEINVRHHVRTFMNKMGMTQPERDETFTVKMWYYTPDGSAFKKDIPLRIAITFFRPIKIEDKEQQLLKEQIFNELCNLLV